MATRLRHAVGPHGGGLWLLALTCGLGLLLMTGGGSAYADTFPGNADHRVADGSVHTYCPTSSFVFEEKKQVAEYAMYYLDATTDMSDSAGSCQNSTDVWWFNANLTGSLRGSRVCAVAASSTVCDRSNVSLDFQQLDIGSNDWYDRRKTSCHELGHSVGLNHDSSGCMISGEVPSTATSWLRYNSHDVGHINDQY